MGHEEDGSRAEVKVNDRRRFSEDGTSKSDAPEKPAKKPSEDMPNKEAFANLFEMDFSTFILSLATSAQVHLGIVANPASGKQEKDMPLAKQTIDILGILEKKTTGNLNDDEKKLLSHLLYDLRMIYLEKSR